MIRNLKVLGIEVPRAAQTNDIHDALQFAIYAKGSDGKTEEKCARIIQNHLEAGIQQTKKRSQN